MPKPADTLITGARVVTPEGVHDDVDVLLRDGRISLLARDRPGKRRSPRTACVHADGRLLLPGMVDVHTHGYGGFDLTLGVYDLESDAFDPSPAATRQALAAYVRRLPALGVTTSVLATMAAAQHTLSERLGLLAGFTDSRDRTADGTPRHGSRLPGAFLEGSFISDRMAGAMNPEFVLRPTTATLDALNATGIVRLLLVAPESGRDALRLVRHATRRGIVCGAGHTAATAEELDAARRAGLRYMVHFLNGPTGHSYKPFAGGGAVEGALADDRLSVELIADGYHVDPRYAREVIARKGPERVIAVSDSMFAAGMSDRLKSFQMNGVFGRVEPDGKYLQVANDPQTLFGSCLEMPTAFGNLASWLTRSLEGVWTRRHEAWPTDDALVAVARMTATNPAHLLGLDERAGIGTIADGAAADVTLAALTGGPGNYTLTIERTWVGGIDQSDS